MEVLAPCHGKRTTTSSHAPLLALFAQHAAALASAAAVLHFSPAVLAWLSQPLLVGVV